MRPVLIRNRSARRGRLWDNEYVDAVAACLLSFLVFAPHLRLPPTVDSLTVANPTPYDIEVALGAAGGEEWLTIVTVDHLGEVTVKDVLDQGEAWRVRFRSQGRDGGELVVSRERLVADDWTVEIPSSVEQDLAARGAPPSP